MWCFVTVKVIYEFYTGVLGSFRRVGDVGALSVVSGSVLFVFAFKNKLPSVMITSLFKENY